jgi:anti-sigma B factor antagonist
MQVRKTRLGTATYLSPDGALVGDAVQSLRAAADAAQAASANQLVIDLQRVPFIDSVGLEYLLDLSTTLRSAGGTLGLAAPGPLCRDILRVTRLDQSIPIFENVESAGRSFL